MSEDFTGDEVAAMSAPTDYKALVEQALRERNEARAERDALRAKLDGMTEWGVRVIVPGNWWVESMGTREECERWITNPPLRYTHQVGEEFAIVKRTAASKWVEVTD